LGTDVGGSVGGSSLGCSLPLGDHLSDRSGERGTRPLHAPGRLRQPPDLVVGSFIDLVQSLL
jgi:hypothetical protein